MTDRADPAGRLGPGTFVAVVGPSGAGKDTVIAYARDRVGDRAVFPRRLITRPPGPGEDHEPTDQHGFAAAREAGALALSWRAHGLDYGVPRTVDDDVLAGRVVVVNVSRAVLAVLACRYERVIVVRVEVSDAVRLARLEGRGRESGAAVLQRLRRADPAPGTAADVEIRNDGTVSDAGDQLVRVLLDAAARCRR